MTSLRPARRGYVAVLMVAVGLWLTGAVQAKTINVPTSYETIQAAINAAVTGDVVVVAKGTYRENIDFKGKAITVRSGAPTNKAVVAATIIDGQKKGSVVSFGDGGPASCLRGFTITNGKAQGGGGVQCVTASPTIANNIITANYGGGIYCASCSPTIVGNTITGNLPCVGMDGGVRLYNSSPIIESNVISGNSGSGVSGTSSSPTLTENLITGNSAASGGGVAFSNGSSPTLTSNVIRGNTAVQGGGVYCGSDSPILTGNTISGNVATNGGGVCFSDSWTPRLSNNVIVGNTASKGGGVYCWWTTSLVLTNETISGNSADYGGGVYRGHISAMSIKNSIVSGNAKGGGVYVDVDTDPRSSLEVVYCDFYGNTGGNYVNWPSQAGKNGNISKNPLFAYAIKGDFHEKSKGGRWNPTTNAWVIDLVHSPCIDAGGPTYAFNNEPAPNGGRRNIGAYGNSPYASKSAPPATGSGLVLTATVVPTASGLAQITVNLTSAASVQVSVLNLAGRDVAVLPQQDLSEGLSTLLWNGRSKSGATAPAGSYLVRVTARSEGGGQSQALAGLSLVR